MTMLRTRSLSWNFHGWVPMAGIPLCPRHCVKRPYDGRNSHWRKKWKIESHRCTIASSIVKYSCVNTRANSRHVVTMASVSGGSMIEKDEVKRTT